MLGVRVMRTDTYDGWESVSVKWLRYGQDDQYNGHSRNAREIFLFAQGIHIGHGQCTVGNISRRARWKSLVICMD